jgi:CRP-like cAMP-binding protein
MGKYTNFLKESDLFYNLTPVQFELIESICQEFKYKRGEFIFDENSKENDLYLILQGKVEIVVTLGLVAASFTPDDIPRVIAILQRGQSFGEMSLVDGGVRSASVRAADRVTHVLMLPRKKLMMLCETYPELGYRVMFNLAADLAQKIRNTDLKLRDALLSSSNSR